MKKTKIIFISIITFLVIIFAALGIFVQLNRNALKSVKTSSTSVSNKIDKGKPTSFLLLGADTGTDGRIDRGNSDTMMLITLNPKTKKSVIYSIPRDALAEMVGDKPKNVQKINAAYNIGKSKMAKQTVSKLLGIPVDYSVAINMEALKKTVDFVDGITITSPMKVSFDGITIQKGTHHLNGKEALTYARMRYQDPRGDYGRQIRQQQVLKAVVKKLENPKYLVNLPKLIKELGNDTSTDLTANQISTLTTKYVQTGRSMDFNQMQGQTAWINDSSYQILSTQTLQNASDKLRKNLELDNNTLNNTETRLNKKNKTFFSNEDNTDYDTYGLDTMYYTNNTY